MQLRILRAVNWHFIHFMVGAIATLVAYDERSARGSTYRYVKVLQNFDLNLELVELDQFGLIHEGDITTSDIMLKK